MRMRIFPTIAVLLLAACSSQGTSTQRSAKGAAASPKAVASLSNPVNFPLYANSHVIDVKHFTQTARGTTYVGRDVIVASGATLAQLSQWVDGLSQKPPSGYTPINNSVTSLHERAARLGLNYAAFTHQENGKKTGLVVVVMDPKEVTRRLGPVLSLIGKYSALPAPLRTAIDNKVQARTGMTVAQATSPESPLGGAIGALNEFSQNGSRAIVLIDAAKQ